MEQERKPRGRQTASKGDKLGKQGGSHKFRQSAKAGRDWLRSKNPHWLKANDRKSYLTKRRQNHEDPAACARLTQGEETL